MSDSKELTPLQGFTKGLAAHEKQFKSVLPAHIPPAKFMRTVVGAVQNNPDILDCNRQSIFSACQKAAQDGLVLDGREAALVPFKRSCQYMPMVAGILKKLRNSGQLSTITAQVVCENDVFSYNPAMDDVPNHSPDWFGDRGAMIGVYAVAKMKDGGIVVEVMNMAQISKVRRVSRSSEKGPWAEWPEEMAKKSVLRRISKYLPSSADVDQMFEHDSENYDLEGKKSPGTGNGKAEDVDDFEPVPCSPAPKEKKTRAAKVIESQASDVDPNTGEVVEDAPQEEEEETVPI